MDQCRMMHTVKGFGEVEKYAHNTFSFLQAIDNIMNKFSYGIDGRFVFPKPELFRTENFEAVEEFFKLIEEIKQIGLKHNSMTSPLERHYHGGPSSRTRRDGRPYVKTRHLLTSPTNRFFGSESR
ncbi:hypothetical protein J6590_097241 [Homalodisca vitripennis]|nr:hypothetical protein J6590_097241 [Homalodisca vitripennis]